MLSMLHYDTIAILKVKKSFLSDQKLPLVTLNFPEFFQILKIFFFSEANYYYPMLFFFSLLIKAKLYAYAFTLDTYLTKLMKNKGFNKFNVKI